MRIDDMTPIDIDLSSYMTDVHRDVSELRVAIVVAMFNEPITSRLLNGALACFSKSPILNDAITVVKVPGAFELPLKAKQLAERGCDGVVCLGCVIRGDTSHFDYVAGESASGIMSVSLDTNKPIIFGVLTTDTIDQAIIRCQDNKTNKGYESAQSLIDVLSSVAR